MNIESLALFVLTQDPVPRNRQEITSVVECRTPIPNVPSDEAGEAAIATSPTDAPADLPCGIGLQFKSSGGMPEVFAVKPDSPCIALDIFAGDILTHVDSAPIAKGTAPRCILDLIRGPSGVQSGDHLYFYLNLHIYICPRSARLHSHHHPLPPIGDTQTHLPGRATHALPHSLHPVPIKATTAGDVAGGGKH